MAMGWDVKFWVAVSLAVALAAMTSGCSTTPYKEDIATFATSVVEATTAFEALDQRASADVEASQQRSLARAKAKVNVSPQCTTWQGGVEQQMATDISCLAAWSNSRSAGQPSGVPPECDGANDLVKRGGVGYYDLVALQSKEAKACELLVDSGGDHGARVVSPITSLLSETPKLSSALRAYASALADIAEAADREALNGSVAEAKVQLLALAQAVGKKNGEKEPGGLAMVGPISDLVGSALGAALERRRLKALQSTTSASDRIVSSAAVLLSNASVPLTYLEIGQSKRIFLATVPGARTISGEDEWKSSYAAALDARAKYLATYLDSPVAAFQAMAVAHTKLKEALADPTRQYDAVKAALSDFAVKAKAVSDAVDESRGKEKKNS